MKKGDKVMIYEDPITEQKPEGVATLIKELSRDTGYGLSCWEVRFDGDDPSETFGRSIKEPSS